MEARRGLHGRQGEAAKEGESRRAPHSVPPPLILLAEPLWAVAVSALAEHFFYFSAYLSLKVKGAETDVACQGSHGAGGYCLASRLSQHLTGA